MGDFETLALLIAVFASVWAVDRKNFERQGLFFLRRTTRWLKAIDTFAKKNAAFLEKYADAGIAASFGLVGLHYLAVNKKHSGRTRMFVTMLYSVVALLAILYLPWLFTEILLMFHIPQAYFLPSLYAFIMLSFVFGLAGYSFLMLVIAGIGSTLSVIAGVIPPSALKLVLPFSVPERFAYLPVQSVPIVPWLVSIFVILIAHEFSHAIIARKEGITVKSMGYGFFGILPLGFAEPDEKEIKRASSLKKTRIFAVGSWSNMVTGIFIAVLSIPFAIGLNSIQASSSFEAGMGYDRIDSNVTAKILPPQGVITEINGRSVRNYTDYRAAMSGVLPGDAVRISVDGTKYNLFAQEDSDNSSRAILGFLSKDLYVKMELLPEKRGTIVEYGLIFLNYVNKIVSYVVVLSIGIALANLLPIKPLDGGLMVYEVAAVVSRKRRDVIAKSISITAIFLLFYTLLGPLLLRGLLGGA